MIFTVASSRANIRRREKRNNPKWFAWSASNDDATDQIKDLTTHKITSPSKDPRQQTKF